MVRTTRIEPHLSLSLMLLLLDFAVEIAFRRMLLFPMGNQSEHLSLYVDYFGPKENKWASCAQFGVTVYGEGENFFRGMEKKRSEEEKVMTKSQLKSNCCWFLYYFFSRGTPQIHRGRGRLGIHPLHSQEGLLFRGEGQALPCR